MTSLSTKFYHNTLIEYFYKESKNFTGITTYDSSSGRWQFENCTNLKELYLGYLLKPRQTDDKIFTGCSSLYKINLRSMVYVGYGGSINANRSMFYHCSSLKRLILPNVINARAISDSSTGNPMLTMYDIGSKLEYINLSRIDTSTGVLVLRGAPPSIQSTTHIPAKIYVHSEYMEQYKEATGWTNYATKIFAIGGEEWVTQFGSTNEYANLTEEEYQDNYA